MNRDDESILSKKPAKVERIIGVLCATLLSVLFTVATVALGKAVLWQGADELVWPFLICTILCLIFLWLLYRFLFTPLEKLRRGATFPNTANEEVEISVSQVASHCKDFLRNVRTKSSFLVVLSNDIGADGGASFAQISIEEGVAGVDHVFTAELNRSSEAKFIDLAQNSGLEVIRKCSNGVDYLRVEPDNPTDYIRRVLRKVLGLSGSDKVFIFWEYAGDT